MRVFFLIVWIFYSGCISNQPPPSYWPKMEINDSDDCPDISGLYSNRGESTNPDTEYQRFNQSKEPIDELWYRLNRGKSKTHAYLVRISHKNENEIRIESMVGDTVKEMKNLRRKKGDFECDDGLIWIPSLVDYTVTGPAWSRVSLKLGLVKAKDGTLIGKEDVGIGGAVLWVIPVGGSKNFWYRWRSVE